jgi:hypothetical protein
MKTSSTKNSLIIGISIVLGASLLSVGVSNAAGSTIKACAKKSGGAMRLIDSNKKCNKNERTLTWGTRGAAGATGPAGAKGETGATGTTGAPGAAGTNGNNGSNGSAGASGISYATYKEIPGIGELSTSPSPQTIGSLTGLASGNYLLNASMDVSDIDLTGSVECRFFIPVSSDQFEASPLIEVLFLTADDLQYQITADYAVKDLPGGSYGEVIFHCYVSGGAGQKVNYQKVYLSATKVDTLVRQ